MSEIAEYMLDSIRRYLANKIDTDAFRLAFVGAYYYARSHAAMDREANALASSLMGPFAEFAAGHRSEESLRKEMAEMIRPFAETAEVQASFRFVRDTVLQVESEPFGELISASPVKWWQSPPSQESSLLLHHR